MFPYCAIRELAEFPSEYAGVEGGPFSAGMSVVGSTEDGIDLTFGEGVEFPREDLVEGNEVSSGLLGADFSPNGVAFGIGCDFSVISPDVAGDEGSNDRSGSFCEGVPTVFSNIPAVGVNGYLFPCGFDDPDFGFVAGPFDTGSRADSVESLSAIVMSELHEDEIALLQIGKNGVPATFGDEAAAATTSNGPVDDGDFRGVKFLYQGVAPALLAGGIITHGGVTDDPKGGLCDKRREEEEESEYFHGTERRVDDTILFFPVRVRLTKSSP